MKLTTQTFMLPVTLIYCIVLCLFGCAADEELSQELSDDETLTLGDRERILAKALDWNNLQVRGPENEELIYEPNQETPYTGWVVRRWAWRVLKQGVYDPEWWEKYDSEWEVAGPGEEWRYEEIFQVRNGEAEGVYTMWYQNGQKRAAGTFKDGYLDGMWTYWYENGQKRSEGEYKGGYQDGMWTEWYENGQKQSEGEYKRNLTEDPEEWQIFDLWSYTAGLAHGMWTYWHENGQKQSEGEYKDGEYEGMWTRWYENGQKREEGEYKNGKKEGIWIEWYENGQKQSEGAYKDGEQEGTWLYWTKDGEKIG